MSEKVTGRAESSVFDAQASPAEGLREAATNLLGFENSPASCAPHRKASYQDLARGSPDTLRSTDFAILIRNETAP